MARTRFIRKKSATENALIARIQNNPFLEATFIYQYKLSESILVSTNMLRNRSYRNFINNFYLYEMNIGEISGDLIVEASVSVTSYTGEGSIGTVGVGYSELLYGGY
jgi:hypothetical protein